MSSTVPKVSPFTGKILFRTGNAASSVPCSVETFLRIAKKLGLEPEKHLDKASGSKAYWWEVKQISRVRAQLQLENEERVRVI